MEEKKDLWDMLIETSVVNAHPKLFIDLGDDNKIA
jgi:uncharacterized Zn-finger protein